jgi:hypothetical protein
MSEDDVDAQTDTMKRRWAFNPRGREAKIIKLTSGNTAGRAERSCLIFGWVGNGNVSVVETCRRLKIPIRDYLGSILPGLANFPINRIAELTPAAWLARN